MVALARHELDRLLQPLEISVEEYPFDGRPITLHSYRHGGGGLSPILIDVLGEVLDSDDVFRALERVDSYSRKELEQTWENIGYEPPEEKPSSSTSL